MLDEKDRLAIDKGMRVLWLIWAAIFASLFIYLFIAHVLGEEIRQNQNLNLPIPLLRNILMGVGIVTIFVTQFLRKFMLAKGSDDSSLKTHESDAVTHTNLFVSRYSTAIVVSLALSESIGIYGLVLFLLGDSLRTLHIFIGAAAVAMFIYRPRREEMEILAVKMQQVSN